MGGSPISSRKNRVWNCKRSEISPNLAFCEIIYKGRTHVKYRCIFFSSNTSQTRNGRFTWLLAVLQLLRTMLSVIFFPSFSLPNSMPATVKVCSLALTLLFWVCQLYILLDLLLTTKLQLHRFTLYLSVCHIDILLSAYCNFSGSSLLYLYWNSVGFIQKLFSKCVYYTKSTLATDILLPWICEFQETSLWCKNVIYQSNKRFWGETIQINFFY